MKNNFDVELNNEKNKKDNRKKLIVVSVISLFTILGGTLAYFTTSSNIKNIFNTAKYETKIVEDFVSPANWTPGTTTKVTNNGTIDMAVRATFTEKWVNANGNELPLVDGNNNTVAIINFDSSWTKDNDGYFYYGTKDNLTKLLPSETSSSFITGVKFNEKIGADLKVSTSDDGKTITYTSSGDGYDNAKYTLVVRIDTVQYDFAHEVW